mmetsp:Transcript_13466/g.20252  ORF Transcript_13466/g.20252 Transcript_13466/m.20252 type:complete len:249 (-) Transcript_13466:118-864(-)
MGKSKFHAEDNPTKVDYEEPFQDPYDIERLDETSGSRDLYQKDESWSSDDKMNNESWSSDDEMNNESWSGEGKVKNASGPTGGSSIRGMDAKEWFEKLKTGNATFRDFFDEMYAKEGLSSLCSFLFIHHFTTFGTSGLIIGFPLAFLESKNRKLHSLPHVAQKYVLQRGWQFARSSALLGAVLFSSNEYLYRVRQKSDHWNSACSGFLGATTAMMSMGLGRKSFKHGLIWAGIFGTLSYFGVMESRFV